MTLDDTADKEVLIVGAKVLVEEADVVEVLEVGPGTGFVLCL